MRIKFLLTVFSLSIFLFAITGCETFDLGPGPDGITGTETAAEGETTGSRL